MPLAFSGPRRGLRSQLRVWREHSLCNEEAGQRADSGVDWTTSKALPRACAHMILERTSETNGGKHSGATAVRRQVGTSAKCGWDLRAPPRSTPLKGGVQVSGRRGSAWWALGPTHPPCWAATNTACLRFCSFNPDGLAY